MNITFYKINNYQINTIASHCWQEESINSRTHYLYSDGGSNICAVICTKPHSPLGDVSRSSSTHHRSKSRRRISIGWCSTKKKWPESVRDLWRWLVRVGGCGSRPETSIIITETMDYRHDISISMLGCMNCSSVNCSIVHRKRQVCVVSGVWRLVKRGIKLDRLIRGVLVQSTWCTQCTCTEYLY